MPTPTKGPRLGGGPAHERLILANLATSLFEHKRITTTEAKAKRLRTLAERLITFAKRGDLAARRRVLTVVRDKGVVHTLFTEIAPAVSERQGGYTRITKIGPRKGDNAPMAVIELVEAVTGSQSVVREAERARGTQTAAAAPVTGATAESAADLAGESPTAAGVAETAQQEADARAAATDEPAGTDTATTDEATADGAADQVEAGEPEASSGAPAEDDKQS